MNSGKGIPRRALEILTCMYNCGLSRRQTVPPSSPDEQKKETPRFFFFFYVNFSQAIQDRFLKERGKQVLFFLSTSPALSRCTLLKCHHLPLFREQQWGVPRHSLSEVRRLKVKRSDNLDHRNHQ